MNYLRKLFQLCAFLLVVLKPINNNLKAAVPYKHMDQIGDEEYKESKAKVISDYYDSVMLKKIEDSIKLLDNRNSITPVIGGYVGGKVNFEVKIYTDIMKGDQDNIHIDETGRENNRCIKGAFDLAHIITPSAYDPNDVFVGVQYINNTDDDTFFYVLHNVSSLNTPCKFAYIYY